MNFLITLHAFSTHKAIIHFKDSKVYVIVFSKRKFCNGGKCHFSCGLRSFHIYSNIWKHPKRQKKSTLSAKGKTSTARMPRQGKTMWNHSTNHDRLCSKGDIALYKIYSGTNVQAFCYECRN